MGIRTVAIAMVAFGACGHATTSAPAYSHKGFPSTSQPVAPSATPPSIAAAPSPTPPVVAAPAPAPSPTSVPPPPPPSVARTYEPPLPLAAAEPPPAGRGPRFVVRGVERDDVLNVRAEPGPKSEVVGQIPPNTAGVVGTGPRRRVGPGVWREVSYGGVRGWVNERFLVEERDGARPAESDARSGQPRR